MGFSTTPSPFAMHVSHSVVLGTLLQEVDGVPTTSDHWLLTEQLRDEFGFSGYVTSDFGAISGLGEANHAVAATDEDCVLQFLEAGGSQNGHDFGDQYEVHVMNLVNKGKLPIATLDRAVGAILSVKARLGLIPGAFSETAGKPETALVDETLVQTNLGDNPKHIATAIRAAQESVVMLANNNGTLPLNPGTIHKLLVLGPNGDEVRTGDYSAAGWAGGAPNGGGNIDNQNSVTILEGLKLAFPAANVTWSVGTGINGYDGPITGPHARSTSSNSYYGGATAAAAQTGVNPANSDGIDPFWTVVQRHSFSTAAPFTPTAPSSPYKNDSSLSKTPLPAGTQGLQAQYFQCSGHGPDACTCTGTPILTRLDAAINFHWFALGPDPSRFRSGTFCVRWVGVITPSTTVKGGQFQIGLGKSRFSGKNPGNMGGRLYVDGKLMIDAWNQTGSSTIGGAYDFYAGQKIPIIFEYYQLSTEGNPSTALLWSLLPSASSDSITPAIAEIASADAVVVVVGGANNDQKGTTEGEGVDRAELSLAGEQMSLVLRAANASKEHGVPLVVVLVDGKPTAEPALKTLPGALLAAFQGGQAAGIGVASVIAGTYNPSGKLPVCFPASAAVLPCYYNHKPSAHRNGYIDATLPGGNGVLWAFGHGLSFTEFAYRYHLSVNLLRQSIHKYSDQRVPGHNLQISGFCPTILTFPELNGI